MSVDTEALNRQKVTMIYPKRSTSNNFFINHPWIQKDKHNEPIIAENEVSTIIEIEASVPIKTGLYAKK